MIPNILTLQMLLHYHAIAAPWPQVEAPACVDAQRWLMSNDLVKSSARSASNFQTTEKGDALIKHILQTPMPIRRWEVPNHEPSN
jgi:hypothetical protein